MGKVDRRAGDARFSLLIFVAALYVQWAFAGLMAFRHRGELHLGAQTFHPFTFFDQVNFSDLTSYSEKMTHLTNAVALVRGDPVFNYPAPAAYVYSGLLNLPHPALCLSLIVISVTLTLAFLLWRVLSKPAGDSTLAALVVGAAVVCAYPFQYLLWRSNLEGIAWVSLSVGTLLFFSRRNLGAALCWGCCIAIKPFPVFFFLLLLRRRKYREIAAGLALCAVLELLALKALGPSVALAWRSLAQGVIYYREIYILNFRWTEARFQHSILDSMKAITFYFRQFGPLTQGTQFLHDLYNVYVVEAVLLASWALVRFWKMPGLNQMFAVVLLIQLLTPVAADYTLVSLYLIWAALLIYLLHDVGCGRASMSRGSMLTAMILFSVLFSPQNYLHYYGGVVKTVCMLALLLFAAVVPMRSSLFDDAAISGFADGNRDLVV